MNFLQAGIAKFRTIVLGHLSPKESLEVEAAIATLQNGWPGHDNIKGIPKFEQYVEVTNGFIAGLNSSDPKRQRKALADPELQRRLSTEQSRNKKLNSLHYFKQLAKDGEFITKLYSHDVMRPFDKSGKFTLRTAILANSFDSLCFSHRKLVEETEDGASIRAAHFPYIADDFSRLLMGHFVMDCMQGATWKLTDDPSEISDQRVVDIMEENLGWRLLSLSDAELQKTFDSMEQLATLTEPNRFTHYFSFFREQDWQNKMVKVRLAAWEEQQRRSARINAARQARELAAKGEAERIAVEKRKLVEEQLTFSVKGETLDISMYGWPRLADPADAVTLFENIKSAFASATRLRFTYLPSFGDQFLVERSIRSMSVRQLACVKNLFWADRVGLQHDRKKLGDLSPTCAQEMLELLNADGHASIQIKDIGTHRFQPLDSECAAEWRANVDDAWLLYADDFHKWIDSETFAGELTRWIVQDPGDSAGWAKSR